MAEKQARTPKSKHKGKEYQYSKNGQSLLDETTTRITEGVFKAAETKAKSLAKNKKSIEVSEDHFRDAIDFILKNGARSFTYWLCRTMATFLASFGVLLASEGYKLIKNIPDKTSLLMISGGFAIAILAIFLDKNFLNKL